MSRSHNNTDDTGGRPARMPAEAPAAAPEANNISLKQYLENAILDEHACMKINELLLATLTQLHRTGRAYLNISSDHITVQLDSSGNIVALNLINFKYAERLAGNMEYFKGVALYILPIFHLGRPVQKRTVDAFAAMRLNFLPNCFLVQMSEDTAPTRSERRKRRSLAIIPSVDPLYYAAMYPNNYYFLAVNLETGKLNDGYPAYPTVEELYMAQVCVLFNIEEVDYPKNIPVFLEQYEKLNKKDKSAIKKILHDLKNPTFENCVQHAVACGFWASIIHNGRDLKFLSKYRKDYRDAIDIALATGHAAVSSRLQDMLKQLEISDGNRLLQLARDSQFTECTNFLIHNTFESQRFPHMHQDVADWGVFHFFASAYNFDLLSLAFQQCNTTFEQSQINDMIIICYCNIIKREFVKKGVYVNNHGELYNSVKTIINTMLRYQVVDDLLCYDERCRYTISLADDVALQTFRHAIESCQFNDPQNPHRGDTNQSKKIVNFLVERRLTFRVYYFLKQLPFFAAKTGNAIYLKKMELFKNQFTQHLELQYNNHFRQQQYCFYQRSPANNPVFFVTLENRTKQYCENLHKLQLLWAFIKARPDLGNMDENFTRFLILNTHAENKDHSVDQSEETRIEASWIKDVVFFADEAREKSQVSHVTCALDLLRTYFNHTGAKKLQDIVIPSSDGDGEATKKLNALKEALGNFCLSKNISPRKPSGEQSAAFKRRDFPPLLSPLELPLA